MTLVVKRKSNQRNLKPLILKEMKLRFKNIEQFENEINKICSEIANIFQCNFQILVMDNNEKILLFDFSKSEEIYQ